MNLQSLVAVLLRLLSLNFFLQAAIQVTPQILRFTDIYQRAQAPDLNFLLALPWLLVSGLIISAIVLWLFALPIARMVTEGVPPDLSLGKLSLVDCYSIVFMGVGLSYLASHLAGVLYWSVYLLKTAASHQAETWKEQVKWYDVSQAFIPFIVGIILFVNGRKWAVALARRQTDSAPPLAPSNPQPENSAS